MDPITCSELAALIGTRHSPLILDVRKPAAFDEAPCMLAGARRWQAGGIEFWRTDWNREQLVVVYCVHGHEVSQSCAQFLQAEGLSVRYLAGGIEEWIKQALPTMLKTHATLGFPLAIDARSVWVTRERPKIDRIACPWLVRRFIDPWARIEYVPSEQVQDYARQHAAIPFDVPKVLISHRGLQGERCSFDTLLEEFGLSDPVLFALAQIVRGADTDRLDISAQSAGLLAISLGLSASYSNDQDMLEQGMVLYDALYAWLVKARYETHHAQLFARVE